MIEKICEDLLKKIRKQMPEIDDERAEVIEYGLELVIGEVPKIILLILIAIVLKMGWLVLYAYITMLPYKITAGGFHLKTNIGCFIGTCTVYFGNVLLSQYIIWNPIYIKHITILLIWILSMIMISMYAPADTVNVPILRKKERKAKKIWSYIIATSMLIASVFIKENTFSNILIINVLVESLCISRLAYKLTKNEYGYEIYCKQENLD